MTPINWLLTQQKLGVKVDGNPGKNTYAALLAHAANRPVDPVILAVGQALATHAIGYEMTTVERLAEFVAQICNETGGFRRWGEDLHYTTPENIQRTWPSRFKTLADAQACCGDAQKLANIVYARASEGNVEPGDGWKYRGRGALQLTFRNNYKRFGQLLGLELEANPDLAADPATSLLIALHFFKLGNVNHYVDAGNYHAARGITNAGSPTYPHPIGLEEVARLRGRVLTVLA